MARPIQLRYDDVTDGETVIGTYLTGDNLIQQASMKNSGSGEYTRMEVKGDKQLKDNLPIDYSQYSTSEPEILVYTLNDAGDWTLRDRVFPEDAGTIKDDGDYRNNNLWGFQKWVGRQKVTGIDETNSTITQIVEALLPSGYTAVTPGDDTVPTLDNYTFNGKIDRAIRDLVRDYPVKIWFTAETDGNGDYIVKVQSKGYGDVVQTVTFDDERQDSGYSIIEFEEQDKSNIVNKVEIEGTDSSGNTIQEIVEDTTSINNHGERYIHRNVGYLESSSQASNIANDILSPDPSPHARMSIPFQDQNILNASIDVLDNRYGIDAVYTVVKQRDFFTEGKTEVELGFEKNRSEERRDRDRELDERNHQLFPTSSENIGSAGLDNADTGGDTSNAERDPNDDGVQGDNSNAQRDPNDDGVQGDNSNAQRDPNDNGVLAEDNTADSFGGSFNTSISSTGWTTVSTVSNVPNDVLYHQIFFQIQNIGSEANIDIAVIRDGQAGVFHESYDEVGNQDAGTEYQNALGAEDLLTLTALVRPGEYSGDNNDYKLVISSKGNASPSIDGQFAVNTLTHSHSDDIKVVDNTDHEHPDDVNVVDNDDHDHPDDVNVIDDSNHGDSDGGGGHGVTGTTDDIIASILNVIKSDR